MTTALDGDGKPISVGSYVSWKGDIEMSGKVESIMPGDGMWGPTVRVSYNDPHTDEPMTNVIQAKRCWQE